jgi:hypothetical protein
VAASAEEFRRSIDEALAGLRELRAAEGGGAAPELRGRGVGADGLIEAVAAADGRIESITVDPRAMRMDSQTIGAEVTTAVNAALDELHAAGAGIAGVPVPDTAALLERLQEVQRTSVQRMETFLSALTEAHRRAAEPRR